MNFNAGEYEHNTGGGSKILSPGEHYCRIIDITMVEPDFKPGSLFVNILLEGPHLGDDFEGIAIDKENPDAGTYNGMIATVGASRYPFSEFEWKGKTIDRDGQIFNWINGLATQLGVFEQIQTAKIQADTIEEYVEKVKAFLTNPELWATYCVAGREYYKDGYDSPNYNLFFPKKNGKKFPYTIALDDKGEPVKDLIRFDEETHIIKADKPKESTDVQGFGGQADEGPTAADLGAPTLD